MRTAVILPVKRFSRAKQRLGQSLQDDASRIRLAQAMVGDVLAAVIDCEAVALTIVVTREETVVRSARQRGAVVVIEASETGQSAAVSRGIEVAIDRDIDRVLCIPGDCPTLTSHDLVTMLTIDDHEGPRVVIVPDRHATGTNGLMLCPPDAIPPSFGPDSRDRHARLAAEAGIPCVIYQPESLLLDIDTSADLNVLRERLRDEHPAAPLTRAALAQTPPQTT